MARVDGVEFFWTFDACKISSKIVAVDVCGCASGTGKHSERYQTLVVEDCHLFFFPFVDYRLTLLISLFSVMVVW